MADGTRAARHQDRVNAGGGRSLRGADCARGEPLITPGAPMSRRETGAGQLDPAAVLTQAAERLRADGHADLAESVERVDAYLRELAVAQTEIALASDRALQRGDALLSHDTTLPRSSDHR